MDKRGSSTLLKSYFIARLMRRFLPVAFASGFIGLSTQLAKPQSFNSPGSHPDRVIVSPDDSELYISNAGNDTITILNIKWWNQILRLVRPAVIPVGKQPGPMAISGDGTRLFIGNRGAFEDTGGTAHFIEGSVSIFDTTAKKTIATIPMGGEIVDLAATPDGKKLYLEMTGPNLQAQLGLKKLLVKDGYPVTWVSRIPCPRAVIFAPDGQRAYVNYQCAP